MLGDCHVESLSVSMGGDLAAEKLPHVTFSGEKECSRQGTSSVGVENRNRKEPYMPGIS